jgi:hypothetical protein
MTEDQRLVRLAERLGEPQGQLRPEAFPQRRARKGGELADGLEPESLELLDRGRIEAERGDGERREK